jgi:putative membrane protein
MRSIIVLTAALATFAAIALAPAAFGQRAAATPSAIPAAQDAGASKPDRKFVETATAAGIAEVEMAKVAQQRGGSTGLKAFADRMVADHGKANRELASIAAAKGIAVPDRISGKDQRALARLRTLRGEKFDTEYLKTQLAAHKRAVALFKREAEDGKDGELKAFASAALPTLQQHLAMGTELSTKRGAR